MSTHESYVSLETAKLLKKAGFYWDCYELYEREYEQDGRTRAETSANWNSTSKYYSAPTLDVAQRWLREVKGVHICVKADAASIDCKYFVTVIISDTKWGNVQDENMKTILFNTYEEAQEAGIKKCLTILLN